MAQEAWMAALRPALSDRKGRALLISTPRGRNWFWHLWQRGNDPLMEDWASWQHATITNPIIEEKEIAEARDVLAESIFRQEYEAAFLEDSAAVFKRVREAATAPTDAQHTPGHRYIMGVDFGRYADFTAVAVLDADTATLVALERFNEIGWAIQRERIAGMARRWQVESIHAEANAMGEPNIEALRAMGLPVVAFTMTHLSKPNLIEGLNAAIDNGQIRLLPDEVLLEELEAFTYTSTRYATYYSAPPGRHDDTVIALALAWKLAATPRLAFAIAEVVVVERYWNIHHG